jgi:hypothetical protein
MRLALHMSRMVVLRLVNLKENDHSEDLVWIILEWILGK